MPGVKGGSYDLRLSPQDRELAIYNVNGTAQFPYYKATVTVPDANNPDDKTIIDNRKFECKVLWPIMVLNCRVPEVQKDGIADTPEDLLDKTIDHTLEYPLDPLDIKYFKNNGNNVTVFIHGYNVEAGELVGEVVSLEEVIIPQAIMNIDETSELDADMIAQESRKKGMITSDWKFSVKTAPYKSSILRDFNMVSTQINQPIDPVILANTWDEDGQDNELNGSGAFNWFLHMEKNINQAAGADFTNPTAFETYTRLLHVTWSGDQGSPNYMESVDESFMSYPAKKLANALAQLKNNGLEVNVIAHSLGNGFLLKTLQVLNHDYPNIQLDHVFMWDAAVPNNVFNRPKPKNNTYDRWDFKNTLNAMQKLTVLHSYNDNILGPFATGDNQKAKIEDVDKAKPAVEWFSAYLCNILNLESLYCIAMALGVETHLILRPEIQEMAYQSLLQHCQDLVANNDTLEEDKADFEKGYYMPTLAEQMRFVSGGSQQSNLTAQIESGMHTFSKDIQDESSRLRKYFILHPQLQTFLEPILIVWDDATRAFKQLKKSQDVDDAMDDIVTAIDWMEKLLGIILIIGTLAAPEVFIQIDIQVALMMLDFEELCESEKVIGYAVKAGEAIGNIQDGIDSVEKHFGTLKKFMSAELSKHQVYGAAYLVQMLTDKRLNAFHVPAMGYKPDDSLLKKNKSKINYVNQTEWLFQHSGMRIPSKDLMQHIYKEQVLPRMNHFGKYPKVKGL